MTRGTPIESGDVRHFLDLSDLAASDLRRILDHAAALKGRWRRGAPSPDTPLAGKTLALIFDKPSTRTRVSFDVGMRQLGGETLMLTGKEMQLGRGESIADTSRVLSRFVYAIVIRMLKSIAMAPVRFVVDSVINRGIIDNFNKIAETFGTDKIAHLPVPGMPSTSTAGGRKAVTGVKGATMAMATGGVLPGWTPGVDVHHFVSPTGGNLHLSGGEAIDLFGALRGGLDPVRRDELLERFALDPTKKCRTYSKGNRQKVAIVAAFASDVELFILDEPTSGLDPLMEAVFQECVRELKRDGRTVLLSSHILAEVEALCDRVTMIRDGKRVDTGTLAELRHLTRTSVSVETAEPLSGLDELPGVHDLSLVNSHYARFQVDTDALDHTLRHLTRFGIRSLTSTPPTLEELFLRHYDHGNDRVTTGVAQRAGA